MMNSNNNGIFFDGVQGPLMTGTWVNPTNGDSFTVRDCYFEDNQLIVQTMDGRILNYNQIQNYVQGKASDNKTIINAAKNKKQNNLDDVPDEIKKLIDDGNDTDILPEDLNLISGNSKQTMVSLGNLNKPSTNNFSSAPRESDNMMIIKKALSKCSNPSFNVDIKWDNNFPSKEIDLLKNVMDIDIQEIISYYINNINMTEIANSIKDAIFKEIEHRFEKKSTKDEISKSDDVDKKSVAKKTTTKKTK